MLASLRLATGISLAGIRISERLVTSRYRCNLEVLCVFLPQRDSAAKQPKLHGISTYRRTCVLNFSAFDEPEHHQALHLWIDRVDKLDDALLASFQRRERFAVDSHNFL
jgi:hypothetical protein